MRVIKGDLIQLALDGHFDVIVHGANCQCTMGAGIAKIIKQIFPKAFAADAQTKKGDPQKLGTISLAEVEREGRTLTVVNAYTQLHYRGAGVRVDYDAIRSAVRAIKTQFAGKRIGYPRIGAGLGGGDWDVISKIISEELRGEDHTLVEFAKP